MERNHSFTRPSTADGPRKHSSTSPSSNRSPSPGQEEDETPAAAAAAPVDEEDDHHHHLLIQEIPEFGNLEYSFPSSLRILDPEQEQQEIEAAAEDLSSASPSPASSSPATAYLHHYNDLLGNPVTRSLLVLPPPTHGFPHHHHQEEEGYMIPELQTSFDGFSITATTTTTTTTTSASSSPQKHHTSSTTQSITNNNLHRKQKELRKSLHSSEFPSEFPIAPVWIEANSSFSVFHLSPVELQKSLLAELEKDEGLCYRRLPTEGSLMEVETAEDCIGFEVACFPERGSNFSLRLLLWQDDSGHAAADGDEEKYLLEFQRRRGCTLQFYAWIRDFMQKFILRHTTGDSEKKKKTVCVRDRWGEPLELSSSPSPSPLMDFDFSLEDENENGHGNDETFLPPPPPPPISSLSSSSLTAGHTHSDAEDDCMEALWTMASSPMEDLRIQALELLAQTIRDAHVSPELRITWRPEHLQIFRDILRQQTSHPNPSAHRSISTILTALSESEESFPTILTDLLVPMVKLSSAAEIPEADFWLLGKPKQMIRAAVRGLLGSLAAKHPVELKDRLRSLGVTPAKLGVS